MSMNRITPSFLVGSTPAVPPGQIGFADDSADNVEAALACG